MGAGGVAKANGGGAGSRETGGWIWLASGVGVRVAKGLFDDVFDGAGAAVSIDGPVSVAAGASVGAGMDVSTGSGIGVVATIAACTGVGAGCSVIVAAEAASAMAGVRLSGGCGVDPDDGLRMKLALSAGGAPPGCVLGAAVAVLRPRLAFGAAIGFGVAIAAGGDAIIEVFDADSVGVTVSDVATGNDVSKVEAGATAAVASDWIAGVGVLTVGEAGVARAAPWSSLSINDAKPLI